MAWWEWLLVLWVGGTAALAILLALVVTVQEGLTRLTGRRACGADAESMTIDLRDRKVVEGESHDGSVSDVDPARKPWS